MTLDHDTILKRDAILQEITQLGRLVVAFSGGVDSALVAALAHRALGPHALAVTAVSETLPSRELDEARSLAAEIGIAHELISFSELEDPRFVENTPSRCFFCQSMRFDQLIALANHLGYERVASGTNASDLNEHRPGLDAMAARAVYQPLLTHQLTKHQVRQLARSLNLSVWDKPAKACLSSRIPHGTAVTEERLRRVERAEDALYSLGFVSLRVRDHGAFARVELGPDDLDRALRSPETLATITSLIRDAGYAHVTLDLNGYRPAGAHPSST
jgi:uncharacterized protein